MFKRYEESVWGDEYSLALDGGDGCTIMWKYLMPLNFALKNGYNSKFHVIYVSHINKVNNFRNLINLLILMYMIYNAFIHILKEMQYIHA